ncbi:tetratricopeptide repeat protein [Pokkaliibacter sp. CJK22405]|uniref:tetratricopeptide repeat protein n=1 Tax=Pokkaliibacter sp. CJK22405 TaxID=3384615 RepID=UPI0039846DB6
MNPIQEVNSPYIVEVTLDNVRDLIQQSMERPVVFDFWADWCAPCKALLPVLSKLAVEYNGGFILAKVDTEDQALAQIVMQFGIRSLPTVYVLHNGQPVDGFSGAQPESEIRKLLNKYCQPVQETEAELSAKEQAEQLIEAGQLEQAKMLLNDALGESPEDYELFLMQANVCAQLGDAESAKAIINGLPHDHKNSAKAKEVLARLSFSEIIKDAPDLATLEAAVEEDGSHSQARFWLAGRLVMAGNYEEAMKQLLTLMRQDRGYGDDTARKTLVKLFDMLGNENPLVGTYRRKLYQALY